MHSGTPAENSSNSSHHRNALTTSTTAATAMVKVNALASHWRFATTATSRLFCEPKSEQVFVNRVRKANRRVRRVQRLRRHRRAAFAGFQVTVHQVA